MEKRNSAKLVMLASCFNQGSCSSLSYRLTWKSIPLLRVSSANENEYIPVFSCRIRNGLSNYSNLYYIQLGLAVRDPDTRRDYC